MKKLDWLHWLFAVFIVLAAVFFWLTLYQYEHFYQALVRTHRVTGITEKLTDRGWIRMQSLEHEYP